MMIDLARLGAQIRADRERLGLSQEDYATRLGLRQSQISDLERGAARRLTFDVSEKLRRHFGNIPGARDDGASAGPPRPARSLLEVLRGAGVNEELAMAMMLLRRIYVQSTRGDGEAWKGIKQNLKLFASLPERPEPPPERAEEVTQSGTVVPPSPPAPPPKTRRGRRR